MEHSAHAAARRRARPILVAVAVVALLLGSCGTDQEPAPRASDEKSTLEPDPSPTSAPEPEPDSGPAFRDFARGGDLPPIAAEVGLYVGNAFTGFVTDATAGDRKAWATCTEVGEYAGRACPISPLEVLDQHSQVDYADRPRGDCLQTYGPVPPDLRALDRTVIVPATGSVDSCIDDFAVQLFVNDDGELAAVSLLLGEP